MATLKARAEEFVAKAIAGEATLIEQNGKRAVLLPCQGMAPDFELDPEMDRLLRQRMEASGRFSAPSASPSRTPSASPTVAIWSPLSRTCQK